jgi:predicted ABC-class ATPase
MRDRKDNRSGSPPGGDPRDSSTLRALLRRIDGGPFGSYRELLGRYRLGEFELSVDRVPPDPYAGPARLRMVASRAACGIPDDLISSRARRLGVEDFLGTEADEALRRQMGPVGKARPGSGAVRLDPGGPAVLERSVCRLTQVDVELRLFVDLPAGGRRIHGRQTEQLFLTGLPRLATSALLFSARRVEAARRAAENVEDHQALQEDLARRGLVAFVADGSLLARAGGHDQTPRRDGREVAFQAPEELRVTLDLPHAGRLSGMGIPAGVTLIVGGGFHGKSTLLEAIARGVHPHRPGDGREKVAALPSTVLVRAEDGRSVRGVDISSFLGELPSGARATDFVTEKASGSTSQAAAIVEALELGAKLLLMDEDRCATNFMVRDGRMQRLVPPAAEPIVPFVDRVREIYSTCGVSTILVTGGSGDYLDVADTVIQMLAYEPRDVTGLARRVAEETRSMRLDERRSPLQPPAARVPLLDPALDARALRAGLRGPRAVRIGDETVDLHAVEQFLEVGQVRALGPLIKRSTRLMDGESSLAGLVEKIEAWLDREGIDVLDRPVAYDLSRPRRFELAAALNRWRKLLFRASGPAGRDR